MAGRVWFTPLLCSWKRDRVCVSTEAVRFAVTRFCTQFFLSGFFGDEFLINFSERFGAVLCVLQAVQSLEISQFNCPPGLTYWRRSFYKQTLLHKQTSVLLCGETLYFFSPFRYWNGCSSCPRPWQSGSWWSFSPRRWDKLPNRISFTRQSTTSPFNALVQSTFTNACSSRYQDSLEVAHNMILLFSCWKSLIFIGGIVGEWFGWKQSSGEMDPSKQLRFWPNKIQLFQQEKKN